MKTLAEKVGYTPGPWVDGPTRGVYKHQVTDERGNVLFFGNAPYGHNQDEANTRLAAASTQMLEALVDLLDCPDAQHYQSSALKAVKAATGKPWEGLS